MTTSRSARIISSLLFLLLCSMISRAESNLQATSLVLEKPQTAISERAKVYFDQQDGETVKAWVFFNDKGIYNKNEFDQLASAISLSDHLKHRRGKVGVESPTFADMAVNSTYINDIVALGGRLRRVSRWLNAASFELPKAQLNNIGRSSFVNKIQPVAIYTNERVSETDSESPQQYNKPLDAYGLSYGSSYNQLQMINVPALHAMGYKGQDVIVAMLDTGYRKSHQAFSQIFAEGRMLAEHDFIFDDDNTQNEAADTVVQHNHGTYTWSTLGGSYSGKLYGPAYGASFLLAKTEDTRSETQVEEDNWVAALEWADSFGADVISSSLAYSDWYIYPDFNGATAVTTLAANTAAGLGIIVCNAMGNSGPATATLDAPADAYNILACGAVDVSQNIASFSSRGPTYDGRTKPEVCAMGVSTYCAAASTDNVYAYVSGTSLSTPLVAGAAALLLSTNPDLTPFQIRDILMETASRAASPDNNYGWGIIDVLKAYNWGANFTVDSRLGYGTLTANFTDSSSVAATEWKWYFGDGDSSGLQNPTHVYNGPGTYDVTLTIQSSEGTLSRTKNEYIAVVGDTLSFITDSAYAGQTVVAAINLKNTQKLYSITIPVEYTGGMDLYLDSLKFGARTAAFEKLDTLYHSAGSHQIVFQMIADNGGGTLPLDPGEGEIARMFFTIDPYAYPSVAVLADTSVIEGYQIDLANTHVNYGPVVNQGNIISRFVLRGDADNSGDYNLLDILYLIGYKYKSGPPPITIYSGDADSSGQIDLLDILYLITYKFKGGPPPAN
jgi:PKD repeat protein